MIIVGPVEQIQVDLPAQDKADFKKTCFLNDETMAQAIRKFIRAYNCRGVVEPTFEYSHLSREVKGLKDRG